jgi:hypothetical protein
VADAPGFFMFFTLNSFFSFYSSQYFIREQPFLDLGFSRVALIAIIKRKGIFITLNGSTVIEPSDKLVIIAENA